AKGPCSQYPRSSASPGRVEVVRDALRQDTLGQSGATARCAVLAAPLRRRTHVGRIQGRERPTPPLHLRAAQDWCGSSRSNVAPRAHSEGRGSWVPRECDKLDTQFHAGCGVTGPPIDPRAALLLERGGPAGLPTMPLRVPQGQQVDYAEEHAPSVVDRS